MPTETDESPTVLLVPASLYHSRMVGETITTLPGQQSCRLSDDDLPWVDGDTVSRQRAGRAVRLDAVPVGPSPGPQRLPNLAIEAAANLKETFLRTPIRSQLPSLQGPGAIIACAKPLHAGADRLDHSSVKKRPGLQGTHGTSGALRLATSRCPAFCQEEVDGELQRGEKHCVIRDANGSRRRVQDKVGR